ncbi:hypothetical protein [Rhizobium glycinendophyticum]|uniref:Uncharacterized protein n=1 Tax=Rhizobium glycinendophyticum TaxID=2589807 RepID=A0A504UX78_9HYPH|nr:hypothetical protein [Rhizobium glycinendophyticum]TPP11361.1 hypothetical protein FJQ55_11285 [Rhizobium glycinendophyticum]
MEQFYFGISLIGTTKSLADFASPSSGYALLVAVLTPITFIYARYEMRNRRLLIIRDFLTSFPATAGGKEGVSGQTSGVNPSLEFVRSKYVQDLPFRPGDQRDFDTKSPAEQINIIISRVRFAGWADMRLLVSSIGMMIVTYYGTAALIEGIGLITAVQCTNKAPACTVDTTAQLHLVGGLAFAGAYLAAIRGFTRGLAVFDLSAFTFIRYTVESIVSVVFILALYRAFPDPTFGLSFAPPADATAAAQATAPAEDLATAPLPGVSKIWLILAPVLGYLPDSATKFALLRLQSLIAWVKMDDDRFNKITRITPLDSLDGIDYATRFRLQECGIYDVQGLATYNPIMLHIESPYGIYQAVDWIAQAQLCHLVGLEKFLVLREMQIRTIFDLERAIDFRQPGTVNSPQGKESPEEFDLLIAGILVAPTQTLRDVCKISGLELLMIGENGVITAKNPDAFCLWFREKLGVTPAEIKVRVEHMMGWIADDLHVRRLRRIWQEISDSLGERSKRLDGEAPKPGAVG